MDNRSKLIGLLNVLDKSNKEKLKALGEIKNDSNSTSGMKRAFREEVLDTIPDGSITASDFSNPKLKKEITDQEIFDVYNRFNNLSDIEKGKIRLGSGAYKDAYGFPDSDLILKTPIRGSDPDLNILEEDYLAHKITESMGKTKDIESPILVKGVDTDPLLLQRRLVTPDDLLRYKNTSGDAAFSKIDPSLVNSAYFGQDKFTEDLKNLSKNYPEDFAPEDIHAGNVGIDPKTNKLKIFDTIGSMAAQDSIDLNKKRFANVLKNLKSPKIYRAIPIVGSAVGAAMSGDVSAAIPLLGEADEAGKGSDLPDSDDSRMVEQASQNATDPNIRKMAIQELRNRNR